VIDQTDRPAKLGTAALPAAVLAAIADCAEACRGTLRELDDDFRERRAAIERGYGQLYVTYYRPDSFGPAYRLELPAALLAREPLGAVLATFRGALRVSSIQEPLPQFLADAICRQLGHAFAATAEGTRTTLQSEFELALVQRYLGPYRTPRR